MVASGWWLVKKSVTGEKQWLVAGELRWLVAGERRWLENCGSWWLVKGSGWWLVKSFLRATSHWQPFTVFLRPLIPSFSLKGRRCNSSSPLGIHIADNMHAACKVCETKGECHLPSR